MSSYLIVKVFIVPLNQWKALNRNELIHSSIVEDDDLLSAFLSSKKKKKKHKHEKDSDQGMSDKKSKKKRKDKKKFKAEDLLQMLGDTELPWEDPEKLVQLNQVVSMGSHLRYHKLLL